MFLIITAAQTDACGAVNEQTLDTAGFCLTFLLPPGALQFLPRVTSQTAEHGYSLQELNALLLCYGDKRASTVASDLI